MNTQTSAPPRVAILGCGHWGKNLVRVFSRLGALAAVNDKDWERARDMGAQFGVPAQSVTDILEDPSIAAVVIAAPADMHFPLAREALMAGKDVFVEKPLALEPEHAATLCDLAERQGRVLMVGHLLQYHPAFLKIKALCAAGTIGRLQYVYSNRLNFGKIRTVENSLWSFAPHDISMILALLGNGVEAVSTDGHGFLHKSVADVTTTHIKFTSGQAAHVFVSWLHPFKEQRFVVIGDKGMLVFDDQQPWSEKVVLFAHQVGWVDGEPFPQKADATPVPLEESEPLEMECRHFLECVTSRATPRTDGREGLQVLSVLHAAQRALETRQPVDFATQATPVKPYFTHETAVVDDNVTVGAGSKIWHFSHVLSGSRVGANCNIGQNVVIGPDVAVGNGCKIQNNVSVYKGVTLEDGVFCGPSMVFTNVMTPRAEIDRRSEFLPTVVRKGASIGANATIVCGHEIGRYAFVGAGAVVTRDVPDHALVVGNPARVIGHVCTCGTRLPELREDRSICPSCGTAYERVAGAVRPVDGNG